MYPIHSLEDPRVGVRGEDGQVTRWPSVNVLGAAYGQPASTLDFAPGYFVVLPLSPLTADQHRIIRESAATIAPAVKRGGKS